MVATQRQAATKQYHKECNSFVEDTENNTKKAGNGDQIVQLFSVFCHVCRLIVKNSCSGPEEVFPIGLQYYNLNVYGKHSKVSVETCLL